MIDGYSVGHLTKSRNGLQDNEVVWAEEKIDGSQFSFGSFNGQLHCRSRGGPLDLEAPDKLFAPAVETAKRLHAEGYLVDGVAYRGEAMCGPRHNVLRYERAPAGGLVLWDISLLGTWQPLAWDPLWPPLAWQPLPYLEHVELLASPAPWSKLRLRAPTLTDGPSMLGGPREGVVFKTVRGGVVHAFKVVSERFREVKGDGRPPKAPSGIESVVEHYRTEARWAKAVAHMREAGKLTGTPRDIGPLIAEVQSDIEAECGEDVREALWRAVKKQFTGGVIAGLPEWYKSQLVAAESRQCEAQGF